MKDGHSNLKKASIVSLWARTRRLYDFPLSRTDIVLPLYVPDSTSRSSKSLILNRFPITAKKSRAVSKSPVRMTVFLNFSARLQ